ncbi:hypothetical protein ACFYO0_40860 [Streptomyces sp. NPDC006365]|uniref:hypothetical protein n=1 Tax=Streptomyces sp. NPDC006365 TaxID=3364744 RepID=UPI0036816097
MLGFGLVLGSISDRITDLRGSALDWYRQLGGTDQIVDAYRTSMIEMAGVAVAIYSVQILLRMRAEEADGTLEPVLTAAVSRQRWAMSHLLNAGIGAVALLLIFAAGLGLTVGQALGDTPAQLRELTGAALAQLPGSW